MKTVVRNLAACIVAATFARADTTVTVDPAAPWLGYMNVADLPANGGTYQFGSGWGVADLRASFAGKVLTLSPNTIADPNAYWYIGVGPNPGGPGAPGNKIMSASMYVEKNDGGLSGQNLTFSGKIVANTLTDAHATVAFIKDFAPDYSSSVSATVPLVDGEFSLSLNTIAAPGRHVQYGFETVGVNVWATDVAPFGSLQVEAVPVDQYGLWIGGFDFTAFAAPDLTKSGDPDGDGQTNLEEFGLDGNPASGESSGKVRSRVETVAGEQALVITLAVRAYPAFSGAPLTSAAVDGLVYTLEGSNGLSSFDQTVIPVIPALTAGMPAPSGNWNYRTFRLSGPIGGPAPRGPKGFLRVDVTENAGVLQGAAGP